MDHESMLVDNCELLSIIANQKRRITVSRKPFAGRIHSNGEWRMPAQTHDFHEMVVVFDGRIHVAINGESYVGVAGDVLLYHAGWEHIERADAELGLDMRYLAFHHDFDAPVPFLRDTRGRIRQLARWMAEETALHDDNRRPLIEQFHAAILAEWHDLRTQSVDPLVSEVRRLMLSNLSATITLDFLASAVGMSKYHFLRTYRDKAGVTPIDDLRRLRVMQARSLIQTTLLPLKAVAQQCGFADQSQMSRMFRKYLDISPGKLR